MTAIKLFGTDGIRGKAGEYPITAKVAEDLGRALVTLAAKGDDTPRIVVGRDTRASGMEFQRAFSRGIIDAGGEAMILGILPTNAVSFAIKKEKADAGIMISASHNPAEENGFKFFDGNGIKYSEEKEAEIEGLLESRDFRVVGAGPRERDLEGYRAYKEHLISSSSSLNGLRVAVDPGNGAASFIVQEVFEKAGANPFVINNKPDGTNINKGCGALHPQQLQREVQRQRADCGVAFDGDADRAVFCDETGKILNGDHIMAVIASFLHTQGRLAHSTLVATNYSNLALDDAMKEQRIAVARVENGDKYVFEEMEKHYYSFGGEQSGHFIFGEFAKTGDGMLTALQLLSIMKQTGKPLSQLSSVLQPYPQTFVNVPVNSKIPLQETRWVSAAIAEAERSLNGTGRVFVRYSGTEPVLRVMIEGRNEKEIKGLAERIAAAAKKEIGA